MVCPSESEYITTATPLHSTSARIWRNYIAFFLLLPLLYLLLLIRHSRFGDLRRMSAASRPAVMFTDLVTSQFTQSLFNCSIINAPWLLLFSSVPWSRRAIEERYRHFNIRPTSIQNDLNHRRHTMSVKGARKGAYAVEARARFFLPPPSPLLPQS